MPDPYDDRQKKLPERGSKEWSELAGLYGLSKNLEKSGQKLGPENEARFRELLGGDEDARGTREALTNAEKRGLYSADGDSDEAKSNSPGSLKDSESSGRTLYNPSGDKSDGRGVLGRVRNARSQTQGLKGRLLKNKFLLGGAVGGGGIVALIMLVLLFASSLKIPHFIENVTAYQFARVTRQMMVNSQNLTSEKLAIDAADDTTWSKIKAKYGEGAGKTKDLHEKMTSRYSPGKIAANYGEAEHFKPIYEKGGVFRGPKLVGVVLDGTEYRIRTPGTFTGLIPGVKTVYDARNSRVLAPYLQQSLKLDGFGPIVRSRTLALMRSELNIGLVAWKAGQYSGKSPSQARLLQAREFNQAVAKDSVSTGKTGALNAAAEEAKSTVDEEIKSDSKLTKLLNNRGVSVDVIDNLNKALTSGGGLLSGLASFISPTYSIALPVCLIYDGSLKTNGPNMDAQQAQLRRTSYYVGSAAAQQKDGYDASPEAIGALNDQLGDTSKSNSEIRANGGTPNTSNYQSAQASPSGDYTTTVFDATFPGPSAGFVNFIADHTCGVFTDPKVGIALGLGSIAGCVLSAGTTCLGQQLAKEGADRFLGRLAGKYLTKVVGTEEKNTALGGLIQKGARNAALTAGAVGAGTLLAQQIVAQHSNMAHNGLQEGTDLADDVDNGFNLESSAAMQRQFYGRPLTDSEATDNQRSDKKMLAEQNQSKSAFERYASINNANSLVSRLAITASGFMNRSIFSSLFNLGGSVLRPAASLNTAVGSILSKPALAANGNTSVSSNYGNVLWGFSAHESSLLKNDPTYKPLENQKILDDSGKEQEIDTKYGGCYGDSKQIGAMLADGDIKRSEDGNVLSDDSKCSPKSLGPDNPEYGDLVLRWRVAQGYDKTLDHLIDQQEVKEAGGGSESSDTASGNAQELAQEILDNDKISFSGTYSKEDVQAAADGKKGTADAMTSAAILKLIATIGQDHTLAVIALQSNGQSHCNNKPKAECPTNGHYNGLAVDLTSLDGKPLTGRDPGSLEIIKIAGEILPSGTGIGQSNCGATPTLPKGFITFDDHCTHLHIQVPKGTP